MHVYRDLLDYMLKRILSINSSPWPRTAPIRRLSLLGTDYPPFHQPSPRTMTVLCASNNKKLILGFLCLRRLLEKRTSVQKRSPNCILKRSSYAHTLLPVNSLRNNSFARLYAAPARLRRSSFTARYNRLYIMRHFQLLIHLITFVSI